MRLVGWLLASVVAACAAAWACYSNPFRHSLLIVNQSGGWARDVTVTVNRVTMVTSPLAPGETREWYECQEGFSVDPTGAITMRGTLGTGSFAATVAYRTGGFWDRESRVIIGPSGALTFQP